MQFQCSKRLPCVRGALCLSVCNIGRLNLLFTAGFSFYNRFKRRIHKKVRFVQHTNTYCYYFNGYFLFLYEYFCFLH